MLLEPAPIDPRPDRTRRQAVVAAVAAAGVLVAVISVGLLGPNPATTASPLPAATSAPEAVTPATTGAPAAAASAATDAAPATSSGPVGGGGPPPRSRFGLDPTSVPAVLEAHALGEDQGTRVTVVGWLSLWPDREACLPGATSSAAACLQAGILAADPGPTLRWDGGRVVEVDPGAQHLRPVFPPGITIPPFAAADTPGSPPLAGLLPVREVVVVGHFGSAGTDGCRLGFLDCSEPFIVDGID